MSVLIRGCFAVFFVLSLASFGETRSDYEAFLSAETSAQNGSTLLIAVYLSGLVPISVFCIKEVGLLGMHVGSSVAYFTKTAISTLCFYIRPTIA